MADYKIEMSGAQTNGITLPHFRVCDTNGRTVCFCFDSEAAQTIVNAISESASAMTKGEIKVPLLKPAAKVLYAEVAAPGSQLFKVDAREACFRGAFMSRSKLSYSDFCKADFSGAVLIDSDLTRSDASYTNFENANLAGCRLNFANLTSARMHKANLNKADLEDAILAYADLSRASLRGANLVRAVVLCANLDGADLRDAALPVKVVVKNLDAEILRRAESSPGLLDLRDYHVGVNAHSRAGWAIVLAGEAGQALQSIYGSRTAASLIYAASTYRPVPDFSLNREDTINDMRAAAAEYALWNIS